jgi:cytochrome c biogenesis protein CcmG/thiol:disulfide interchange protein DsbE
MQKKSSFKKSLLWSLAVIAAFGALMIYGLNHNPSFNPSQLVGKKAPAFTAMTNKETTFQSSSIFEKKQWKVIHFWTSSCYICRSEAPEVENFYQNVTLKSPTNPIFVSINIQDDPNTIAQWQKDYGQTFPVVEDSQGLISVDFGVTGTPETFFVDPRGVVRYRIAGSVTSHTILSFIHWLEAHPQSSQDEATKGLNLILNGTIS